MLKLLSSCVRLHAVSLVLLLTAVHTLYMKGLSIAISFVNFLVVDKQFLFKMFRSSSVEILNTQLA